MHETTLERQVTYLYPHLGVFYFKVSGPVPIIWLNPGDFKFWPCHGKKHLYPKPCDWQVGDSCHSLSHLTLSLCHSFPTVLESKQGKAPPLSHTLDARLPYTLEAPTERDVVMCYSEAKKGFPILYCICPQHNVKHLAHITSWWPV